MTDLEALKTLVALARKLPKLPFAERDGVQNADFAMATVKALPALERLLASQGKPEAEAVPGSSVCPICGKDSPHYHKPEEATMYNAKFVGVGPQFVQDALQHVYAAMDAMRRKGARENYDRGYNAGFNVSADILEAALKQIKSKLGWIAERTGEFPPIVFDAESAANRPLPSDKLRGLVRKLEQMEQYHRGMWTDSGDSRYDAEYARMHEAFADELKAMLSQEPSSGATVTADVEPASLGAAETTLKAIAKASRDRIHNAGCWSADFIFEVLTDEFRKHQPIKAGDSGAEE